MSNESPDPATPEKPGKKVKIKKPGRWRRRFVWFCAVIVLFIIAVRAVVPLLLPTAIRKIAGIYNLNCTYDRLELNIISGDAGIWGIKVMPNEGGPAILDVDYCHGNISVADLLKGQLDVWRMEADGVDVNIDRNPDGHIPLLDRFVSSTATVTPTTSPTTLPTTSAVILTSSIPAKPIDLASPVRVDALRLGHIRVHLHDRGVTPEVDTDLAMDLRLSDLGSTISPTRFELNVSADPLLDSLRITGQGSSGGKRLDAEIALLARGIRLKPAAGYLRPFGIVPIGDSITLSANGHVHTASAPANAEGFSGSLDLDHLSAKVDGTEAMAVDQLSLTADAVDTRSIHLGKLLIKGGRATAGRAADGHLRVAGIEFNPTAAAKAKSSAPESPAARQTSAPILSSILALPCSLAEATVENARIDLHDQDVLPAVDLSLVVEQLSAKNIDHDPRNLNTDITLSGTLHAPGMARAITLSGHAKPFAQTKTFTASLKATGIRPDAIRPYLDQAGLESQLKDATFTAGLRGSFSLADDGVLSADVAVEKVNFADKSELFSLNEVNIAGITVVPATGKIGASSVEISGPGLSVQRDKTGQFAALGLVTKPRPAIAAAPMMASQTPPTGDGTTIASLPSVTIGSFIWKDIRLNLQDQTVSPPVSVTLSDLGVDMKNLTTDLDANAKASPGQIHAWLASPTIARRLEITGGLAPRATGLDFNADVSGDGITLAGIAPYLKPLGIEPVLKDGSLHLHTAASIEQTDTKLTASLALDHLRYSDGRTELAAIDDAAVKGITLVDGALGVDEVKITRPHAIAKRDADGSLEAGGIRLLAPKPADTNAAPAQSSLTPVATAPAIIAAPAIPFVVICKSLAIEDASVAWTDAMVKPTVKMASSASVHLDDFVFGKTAPPASLKVIAHADGAADNCTVAGKVSFAGDAQSAVLDITATGLRAGPIAPYFPPGIAASLKDGQFHTTIDASIAKNPAGGLAAQLKIGPVDFRDGTDPLFKLDAMNVIVPRIDLPDNALAVQEISVAGLETHAEKMPDGTLQLMGLTIGGAPTGEVAPAAPNESPKPAIRVAEVTPPVRSEPVTSVSDMLAASKKPLPLITVDKLDVNVSKLTLADQSRPQSKPLMVSDLRFFNVGRIQCLGKNPTNEPPTHLQFSCRMDSVIDHVLVDFIASPFVKSPHLQIDFAATGVRGDGVTGLVPELKPKLDGENLTNGSLTAHLEADAKLDRLSPIDFDLSRGFDLSFALDKVYYRGVPDGPVLAGVDEIQSENIRIQPAQSTVHFKKLEITKPIGLVTVEDDGVHAMGWVLKLPKPQTDAAAKEPIAVTDKQSPSPVPASEPSTQPAIAVVKPVGEIRIDRLLISGLDVQFDDYALNPPLVIPLNGLDVDVRNISSLAPYEDLPMRFSAIVNAGKVKLRKRESIGAGIATLFGKAEKLVGVKAAAAKPPQTEERDLFAQITATGEISLYPKLHGWAKTSVSGLDLAALEGAAKQQGVSLTNGLYDSDVNVRFNPDGSVTTDSKFVLTDLVLSEPSNGPISRFLKLPAPLDAAIGAVQGADGSISLPVHVEMDPAHISYTEVALAVAGGVSKVLANAVASAPVKVVNDVGSFVGFGGAKKAAQTTIISLPFQAGAIAFEPSATAALSNLLVKMKDDPSLVVTVRHQLGSGDVTKAAERANPSKQQCDSLQEQLRTRKVALLNLRADTAGTAEAELMSKGAAAAEPTLRQLRAIDRDLAGVEDSLDEVCDLLRPGAEKRAQSRTRAAALQIAAVRLAEVKNVLLDAGLPDMKDRVKVIDPRFDPGDLYDGAVVITVVQKK